MCKISHILFFFRFFVKEAPKYKFKNSFEDTINSFEPLVEKQRFCDKSVYDFAIIHYQCLKCVCKSFPSQARRYNGFPVTGRYWCHCYQCSFIYKIVYQCFEILIFSHDVWGNVHYVRKTNLIFEGSLIKAFYVPNKIFWKKSETRFCRRKTAEDSNAKINIFPNMPCTFSLFKASAVLQSFFPKKLLFQQVLRTSVFVNS